VSDHEETICPVCGSMLIFLDETIDDDLDEEELEMLILMDEDEE
jgi:hypothetical protein